MERKKIELLPDHFEEYLDPWTPGKLAWRYCDWLAPNAKPALIRRTMPRGYLIAELLRCEFGIRDKVTD